MKLAAGELRNMMAEAISSGFPQRAIGVLSDTTLAQCGSSA
jgi:hypothetical protein